MQFTGKNLSLVRNALELAIDNLNNEIAICPDVITYAEVLDDIEAEKQELAKLIARIDKKLPPCPTSTPSTT